VLEDSAETPCTYGSNICGGLLVRKRSIETLPYLAISAWGQYLNGVAARSCDQDQEDGSSRPKTIRKVSEQHQTPPVGRAIRLIRPIVLSGDLTGEIGPSAVKEPKATNAAGAGPRL